MLDDFGLLPALLWHFERYTAQTGVTVAFHHEGLERRFFAGRRDGRLSHRARGADERGSSCGRGGSGSTDFV